MACSITALFTPTPYTWTKIEIFYIPITFLPLFFITLFIAEEVRNSFKKVLKFHQRKDPRPLWQVGVGMIFFFTQIGFVEVFWRSLMVYELGGMPLYLVISFMNAFLITVIFEEIFYPRKKASYKN
ncbi:DNA polymerase I [Lysinibacillus antri]|uniref:DNA polymerase I n=2 Tax=Bacillaceae TaxID=186817 RepID=A0A432LG37_9BACI|nr:DNA polymerase I [Lysinibacillus antri]TSI03395.1 DNA polymerase I [Lysinibacillus sp. BW-2-10]